MKLTLKEQRKLIKALPAHRISACRNHCQMREMQGSGIKDILKSIGSVLGSVTKELGPTVLKELIIPMLQKKVAGNGLRLPGRGMTLSGQGKKKPKKKTKGNGLKLAGRR